MCDRNVIVRIFWVVKEKFVLVIVFILYVVGSLGNYKGREF